MALCTYKSCFLHLYCQSSFQSCLSSSAQDNSSGWENQLLVHPVGYNSRLSGCRFSWLVTLSCLYWLRQADWQLYLSSGRRSESVQLVWLRQIFTIEYSCLCWLLIVKGGPWRLYLSISESSSERWGASCCCVCWELSPACPRQGPTCAGLTRGGRSDRRGTPGSRTVTGAGALTTSCQAAPRGSVEASVRAPARRPPG